MGTITDKPEGMDADMHEKIMNFETRVQNKVEKLGNLNKITNYSDDEKSINKNDIYCNVYGSKLTDVQEINRLKDENLTLKLIIGDMELKIFELSNKLHISKEEK